MKLYNYFRSSAAYRLRIALNLKGLDYEDITVHLVQDGGQQHTPEYKALNPQGLVPTLLEEDGTTLTQSMAILEYLDEVYPGPKLLPTEPTARAWVRALANIIACDIHPLNNLRVLKYLTGPAGISDEQKTQWYHHWIIQGFTAIEAFLKRDGYTGEFCYKDAPTMADLCLVPQVYNALRFDCPMDAFPTIERIYTHCLTQEAFQAAQP